MVVVDISQILQGIINSIVSVIAVSWWVVLPLAMSFIAWKFWLYYIYIKYLRSQTWVLLEVKIPAIIEKTPKAMEQVFAAVYGIFSFGFTFRQKYIEGHLTEDWISFELIGFAGGVHFYVRTPDSYRNIVESAVYAQYPDAEVHQASDYLDLFPKTLPNKVYDIFGTDYHLVKENAYPIRTYEEFEEAQEEKRLDPIAAITEAMSKLKNDEAIFIQIFVSPTGTEWKKEAEALRDKLIGRKKPAPPKGIIANIGEFLRNFTLAAAEPPVWEGPKEEKKENFMMLLTPGERDIIEAIENKISKLGFNTNIRFLYVDKRDSFTRSNIAAVMSTFHQFSTQNLNSLRPNLESLTVVRGNLKLNKTRRLWYKKRRIWDAYRKLIWPRKTSILNTEELATIFHFPLITVEAPLLGRIDTKRGEPPSNLPIS
jgi:hypothetical protein